MAISDRDKTVMRRLADEWAKIAALPVHAEKTDMWRRLNGLEKVKPMVWINEIPWHEMDVDGELRLRTRDPFCRGHEVTLRRTIYQWRHMPADMIVEPVFYSPLVIHDTGFGITEEVDIAKTDEASDIVSRRFHLQIQEEEDIDIEPEKIVLEKPIKELGVFEVQVHLDPAVSSTLKVWVVGE